MSGNRSHRLGIVVNNDRIFSVHQVYSGFDNDTGEEIAIKEVSVGSVCCALLLIVQRLSTVLGCQWSYRRRSEPSGL